MERLIYLNDLLHLTQDELKKSKIKFNQWNGSEHPMDIYKRDPEEINSRWLFWRTKTRYFNVGQYAICLLKLSYDTWLLTTIKEVTEELGIEKGVNYIGEEVDKLSKFYGRVILKYRKTFQTQCRWAESIIDDLEVVHILSSTYDGEDFPGYDNIRLSFNQLETIIKRNKKDWIAALENQKAVYLITDKSNGKQYVGSAYGDNGMLLQRWTNYINNGHGGNVELREIVNDKGFDYVKQNFQYSILENYNSRIDSKVILNRESWWKETLQTRKHGYNNN
jgi:hypothetical protein